MLLLALGLATGCVYGLIAIAYSLTYQTTGIVDFSEGAYVVGGGMATYWFFQTAHLPYGLSIVLGVATAGALGAILYLVVLEPLRRRGVPRFVFLLATVVYANLVTGVLEEIFGTSPVLLPAWFGSFHVPTGGGGQLPGQDVLVVVTTLVVCAALALFLKRTLTGRALRACGAGREVAGLLGVSVGRISLLAAAGTAMVGGLAGAVIAPVSLMSYSEPLSYGLYGVTGAVLGGFGNLWGSFVGGVSIGVLYAVVGRYLSSGYQDAIVFCLLFVLLLLRPRGIFGVGVRVAHD